LKKGGRSHLFLIEIKREYTQHTNAFSKEKMIIKKDTSPEKRNKFSSNRERKFRVTVDAELSECDGGKQEIHFLVCSSLPVFTI
jgi:hypothetical protein